MQKIKIIEFRIVRFALIGVLATLTHISIAFLSVGLLNTTVFFANLLGFVGAFFLSYWLQSTVVFNKKISWKNARRFFCVQFCGLIIAQAISQLFSEYNPYLRILFVVFLIPLITYFIHQVWTYNDDP